MQWNKFPDNIPPNEKKRYLIIDWMGSVYFQTWYCTHWACMRPSAVVYYADADGLPKISKEITEERRKFLNLYEDEEEELFFNQRNKKEDLNS